MSLCPQLSAARVPDLPGRAEPLSAAPSWGAGQQSGARGPRLAAAGPGGLQPSPPGWQRTGRPVRLAPSGPPLRRPGARPGSSPYLAARDEPPRRRPAGAAPAAHRAPGPLRPPVPPCRRCRRCGAERGGAGWRERGGAGAAGEEETKSRQSRARIPGTPAGARPRRPGRGPGGGEERSGAGRGAPSPGLRATHRPPWHCPPLAQLPLTEIECGRRRFTGRSGSLGPPSCELEPPQQRRSIPARESQEPPPAAEGVGMLCQECPAVRCQAPGRAVLPGAGGPPGAGGAPGAGEERGEPARLESAQQHKSAPGSGPTPGATP